MHSLYKRRYQQAVSTTILNNPLAWEQLPNRSAPRIEFVRQKNVLQDNTNLLHRTGLFIM